MEGGGRREGEKAVRVQRVPVSCVCCLDFNDSTLPFWVSNMHFALTGSQHWSAKPSSHLCREMVARALNDKINLFRVL